MATEPQRIMDIPAGDAVDGLYVLRRCELKEHDGGFRLVIDLADRSGHVAGVIWENARELSRDLVPGTVVSVQGRMGTFRDSLQVRVDGIRTARAGEYKPDDFLPRTPADMDALAARIRELVAGIADPHLARLAASIFENDKFMREYSHAPGGMKWHHPYLGGLLEHSVGVAEICEFVAGRHPDLNRDLLVLAGLLHDVGKIREYSADVSIDYTDEGRLEGHIVIGERFVRSMCDRIEGFPSRLRMLLSHLMLSHQGHKEFSSPIEPMIPEGFVLYFADEIDSKLNALRRIADDPRPAGERWSEFVRLLGRFIYLGPDESPSGVDEADDAGRG